MSYLSWQDDSRYSLVQSRDVIKFPSDFILDDRCYFTYRLLVDIIWLFGLACRSKED